MNESGLNWGQWANFSEDELRCPCGCGRAEMHPRFMDAMQQLRTRHGEPLIISSGFRCAQHNRAVGGHPTSAHMKGEAADILKAGESLRRLLPLIGPQFTGIGLSQSNRDWSKRFIHLDMAPTGPRIWSYPG